MIKLRLPQVLTAPGFLVGLAVLLVNDFVLKQLSHNWLTGKLSDVAGLFIFPLFVVAFLPQRKLYIYLSTAAGFAFWKSGYSQPLINNLNLILPFSVGRTVDVTDLFALLVLPASYVYGSSPAPGRFEGNGVIKRRRLVACIVCIISIFAFTATSYKDDQSASFWKEYQFNVSREELIKRLYKTDLKHVEYLRLEENTALYPNSEDRDLYTGFLNRKACKSSGMAYMNVYTRGEGKSALLLKFILYSCDTKTQEQERELLEEFEQEVVEKLREQQ
jgi:hypothetical protein